MGGKNRKPSFQPLPYRVLWHSNAPWAGTGYGTQTAVFAPRVAKLVDGLAISAFYGLHGGRLNWKGIPVLPNAFDAYGSDIVGNHFDALCPDRRGIMLTLTDPWVLDPTKFEGVPVASWVPVDHDPLMPPTAKWFDDSRAVPIAMSRFGERMLSEAGYEPLYVPHGYEADVMFPRDRARARQMLGVSESQFVVGMVAANISKPSRKCFPEAFRAFAAFARAHDDAVLYVHAHPFDKRGFNLPELAKASGIPDGMVRFAEPYTYMMTPDPGVLAHAYSAMDVLLSPSAGEGFGLPVLEAQACGTPVIVTRFSAQPELCGAGWMVEGQPTWTGLRSWQVTPIVEDIIARLEDSYAGAAQLRGQAVEFAKGYEADHVTVTYWVPALKAIQRHYGF